MIEESIYRWLGYTLLVISMTAWLVFDHSEWGLSLIGLCCMTTARVVRLERQFKQMLAASHKALGELTVRDEQVP
jgi:hypothetical protein